MSNDARIAAAAMAAECLCFRARRTARAFTRAYEEALRPLGIPATQLTLLNAIALGGERGQRIGWLVETLAMDQTTLSRNLRLLETSGLARLDRLPADRRVRIATLTPEGRRVVTEALPLWRRAQESLVAALGAETASDLRTHLDEAAAVVQNLT